MASESLRPPSMSSSRLAITWRKPGLSTVSRRSVSASMMLTPAFSSCERWKQKVMSSVRETRRERAAVERLTPSKVRRSRPRRLRRSSRSIALAASRLPVETCPSASTAL
jgi:hypothetical protein